MSTDDLAPPQPSARGQPRGATLLLLLFTVAIFANALLLFLVQPMTGKLLLPRLGGTPAVWNACMLFFQAVLLAGYAYAHASARWLAVGVQVPLHLALLALAAATLPFTITRPPPDATADPTLWTLGTLALTVGPVFLVISAGAPLLQSWFARTGHSAARDPYFLYAASNTGSLLALLGYPLMVERLLTLPGQAQAWRVGYLALLVLAAGCGAAVLWRRRRSTTPGERLVPSESRRAAAPVSWRARLGWIGLAFLPSSLMLGVTTHITTDIAPVPLLWVVPLALYILTYILAFARRGERLVRRAAWGWSVLVLPVLSLIALNPPDFRSTQIILHLVTFFCAALVCHGQLAARRPDPQHLTEYYLLISPGGVLGGVLNALIAPVVLPTVLEYPLVLAATALATPLLIGGLGPGPNQRWIDLAAPLGLVVVALGLAVGALPPGASRAGAIVLGLLAVATFGRPARFAAGLLVVALAQAHFTLHQGGQVLRLERNFFGVKRVLRIPDGGLHVLGHGGTIHGAQFFDDPVRRRDPLVYYTREGPCGDLFRTLGFTRPGTRVGAIGLGVGSIATYAQPGQEFVFYEIDPAVLRIAEDPNYFTFLSDGAGRYTHVIGDGRLMIERAPDGHFGMVLIDAFSSDAVPAHLLTREALRIYLQKADERGWIAFHASNAGLDLVPVLANVAADAGLVALHRHDPESVGAKSASDYVVMARRIEDLGTLPSMPTWRRLEGNPRRAWTDHYSNIAALIRWR